MNYVIDANCWKSYAEETLAMEPGLGTVTFERAKEAGKVILDDGGHIRQQYFECMRGQEGLLAILIETLTTEGKLRLVVPAPAREIRVTMNTLGVPTTEWMYFRCAVVALPSYIVSNDIDFFNPKLKLANAKAHVACKQNPNAPVCKAMRKTHGVQVLWMEAFAA